MNHSNALFSICRKCQRVSLSVPQMDMHNEHFHPDTANHYEICRRYIDQYHLLDYA